MKKYYMRQWSSTFIFIALPLMFSCLVLAEETEKDIESAKKTLVEEAEKDIKSAAKPSAGEVKGDSEMAEEEEMLKDEIMDEIMDTLDEYEGIAGLVPGLQVMRNEEGNIYYTYSAASGIPVRLKDLDGDALVSLLSMVQQAIVRHQSDMVARQMRIISEIQRLRAEHTHIYGDKPHIPRHPPQPPHIPASSPHVPQTPKMPER